VLRWIGRKPLRPSLAGCQRSYESGKLRSIEHCVGDIFGVNYVSERARAIRFLTIDAPQDNPTEITNIIFDEKLALEGFDLPAGTQFSPGDIVPVSLAWMPIESLPEDYNVSAQVATQETVPLAQRDGQPQATFGHMTQWETDKRYRDNHGILLPNDIPPGDYVIQVVVYRWQDGQRLPYTDGEATGDIARLATITVSE
jgi:hypothetical protein